MNDRLQGQWAFITGASAGIGKAICDVFAAAGCNLIITARRNERLQQMKASLQADYDITVHVYAFDIRDAEACKKAVEAHAGSIDILINNAGLAKGVDPVYEADLDDWDTMIDTNVKGLLTLSRYVSAAMKERGRGHIINIGSIAGHEAYAGGVVYCATKYAVKAITEATKKDLHGTPIRVSMVSPGLVETEFSNVRFSGDDDRANAVYEDLQPLTPVDIAEIVAFTASRPPHVNIMDSIVFPVAQSSATMVHRNEA